MYDVYNKPNKSAVAVIWSMVNAVCKRISYHLQTVVTLLLEEVSMERCTNTR